MTTNSAKAALRKPAFRKRRSSGSAGAIGGASYTLLGAAVLFHHPASDRSAPDQLRKPRRGELKTLLYSCRTKGGATGVIHRRNWSAPE
jgi:hypothetical protein